VNGQQVAFHVNDLKFGVTNNDYSTAPSLFGNSSISFAAQQTQQKKNYAPPQRPYESDLIVVLDMDECLIHSEFLQNPQEAAIYAHQLKQRRQEHQHNNNNNNDGLAPCDSFRVALRDGDLVHVHVRPGLLPFLRHVTSRYETHIFTAGMEIYAKPILDYLCSAVRTSTVHEHRSDQPVFAGRWYREHCTWDRQRRQYVKDLSKLALPGMHKTVLVDNNPDSFHANPENGIMVNSFYDDARDDTLSAVAKVLADLEGHADVRPILGQRFQLAQAIQSRNPEKHLRASVVQFAEEEAQKQGESSSQVPHVLSPEDSLILQDVRPQVACFA
jgi:CTD small phosphatase-like protein 2